MTEKKTSPNNDQADNVENTNTKAVISSETSSSTSKDAKVPSSASANKSAQKVKTRANKVSVSKTSSPAISKTAILALLVALISLGGIAGVHFWHLEQQQKLAQTLSNDSQKTLNNQQNKISALMNEQENNISQQLSELLKTAQSNNQVIIDELSQEIEKLSQNEPSDWLIHESEYLIRVAARTMWLERDTQAAIGLLNEANGRINELNDPKFLPILQLIHQDINALKLMPTLDTQEVVLTLMGLSKQVPALPLVMAPVPETSQNDTAFELSENTDDWRANLKKSWDKFLADFISVRKRSGTVEPLLSPQYHQHLIQNLSLKLQLAQWAASEEKPEVYSQALDDILLWLSDYFDMNKPMTKQFYQRIESLQSKLISFNYPSTLSSLQKIRSLIKKPSGEQKAPVLLPKEEVSPDVIPESAPVNIEENNQALKEDNSIEEDNTLEESNSIIEGEKEGSI